MKGDAFMAGSKAPDRMKEITDRLEQGIQELFNSEKFTEYLKTMSKFYNYSYNNVLLISMQRPDATLIAGYNAWQNNFDRHVKRGEKGIKILAPCPYKKQVEMEKIDPATQRPVVGNDGKPVTEVMEVTKPAFRAVTVFDVSQTEGKELPSIAVDELTGNVKDYEAFFEALKKASPVPVGFEKIKGGAKGYYHQIDKRIAINEGMSEVQNVKTAIHEIAHAKLHDIDQGKQKEIPEGQRKNQREREVEAESIAYTVCQHYGIDTSDYSFGYVAGWSSGKETKELKASLELIRETAADLINTIDGNYREITKARQQLVPSQTEKEMEPMAPPNLDPSVQPVVTVLWSEHDRLTDGEKMSFSRADQLFQKMDEQQRIDRERPDYQGLRYYKTQFSIEFTHGGEIQTYEGRQDFGDGDGSLIDHIKAHADYCLYDEQWQGYLASKGDKETVNASYEWVLNEFAPYLQLHNNLSKMEQAADTALQTIRRMPESELGEREKGGIAYYEAVHSYVSDCRRELNTSTGPYQFPKAPKLEDFVPEHEAEKTKPSVKEQLKELEKRPDMKKPPNVFKRAEPERS